MTPDRVIFFTPTFRPAGGVVKLFDYMSHALAQGLKVEVCCAAEPQPNEPSILDMEHFAEVVEHPDYRRHHSLRAGVGSNDLAIFSWPPHFDHIAAQMDAETPHANVVHLIQGVRHGNPEWIDGYGARLLSRPMTRIMVSDIVAEVCRPYLNTESRTEVILEAHRWDYFSRQRSGGLPESVRVGYTTWKSDVGHQVRDELLSDDRFSFVAIEETASWADLRELYHASDVFICAPGPEEGFYLPGLEAMAAGALVLAPDVVGNRAYCRFGENCLEVVRDDVASNVQALQTLVASKADSIVAMRDAAYRTLERHRLDHERDAFASLVAQL